MIRTGGGRGRPGLAWKAGVLLGWMLAVAPVAGAERPATDCGRPLDEYQVRTWTRQDGLPLDTVYAVAQTPDGFLWVGTEDGVARFDGSDFVHVDLHPATSERESEAVYGLAVDAEGVLHMATGSSGVLRMAGGRPRPWDSPEWAQRAVWALLADSGGGWAGVRGAGLVRYEGSTVRLAPGEQPGSGVTALARRRAGGVWVGYAGSGVHLHDGAGFAVPRALQALGATYVEELLEDERGRLWIGAREGLWRLDGQELRRHTAADGLAPGGVRSLMRDRDGRLWVGMSGTAIARQCGARFERLDLHGYATGQVESLFQGEDGSIWLATSGGGLVQLVPGGVVPVTARHGLPDAPILPILQARDGAFWIGTFGAGVVRWRDGTARVIGRREGLSDDNVLSLEQTPDGAIWVGTRNGLNRIQDGRVARIPVAGDLRVHSVPALRHDGSRLWVSAMGRLARVDGEGRIHAAAEAPEELGSNIVFLHAATDGRLWIGTEGGGAHVVHEGRLAPAPFNGQLPSLSVLGFHEAADGGLWVATARGLAHWDGNRVGVVSIRHGLLDDQIMRLLPDGQGRLWMSGNRGVFAAAEQELLEVADGRRGRVAGLAFDEQDGMPRAEANGGFQPAGWRATDGRLWFPTTSGIAVFDPQALVPPAPPPVRLLGVVGDGLVHPPAATLALDPRPKLVEFRYAAPSFIHARRLQFQYRLQGFDDDWYAAGPGRTALYHRLPPGRYRFEVRARHAPGPWSAPSAMALEVRPHLLQSAWFWVLAALLSLGAAGGLLRLRLQALARRQERRLQAQKLESIGLLATGIAHDFNNILAAILPRIESLRQGIGLDNPLREQADEVREATERGAGLSRQLLAFGQRQAMDPQWTSLVVEVESMSVFLQRLLPGTIELDVRIAGDPGPCRIDPVQLQQVLLNLALNARDAMPGGGRLAMELGPCRAGAELQAAGLDPARPYARIAVRDSGGGMSSEERSRIFEPFFTTKAPGKGSGLGLAISQTIVKQAGGALRVESTPGAGATFLVYLPVAPDHAEPVGEQAAIDRDRDEIRAILRRYGASPTPAALTSAPMAEADGAERRMLVVDDDPAVAGAVAEAARERGFTVALAHDAAEFLRRMDEWRPTDVVVDLAMPGRDGVELLRILSERGTQARILLMSGLGMRVLESVQRSARERGLGVAGVLAKPFRREDLLALLSDTRARGRQQPARAEASAGPSLGALEEAIAQRRFVLHYQPKVRLADGRVSGFEALVRWSDPVRGMVPPDAFIPLAESSGLILPLTDLVIEQGLAWLARQSHQPPLTLALNLSGKGVGNPDLADALHARCTAHGLDPARIILELTESSAAAHQADAMDTLSRLRIKGFQLSIDDFGTGFSSMVQLARLPFTSLKIDKSFVLSMLDSAESRKIVESTIGLGKALGLATVAEGVEQSDVLSTLRALGCDEAQGFLIARPMDGDAAHGWLAAGRDAGGGWMYAG
jgi:EAL domain-containing protein (putative c-di-GMP-specific phosphodiesterase class I)/signal transduction histidine kinase/ligand-binding sensor domain-containing protein/CheY-like chemotaxis protein